MAETINAQGSRKVGLLAIPGVVVSLLPVLACGWPAIAALVSSLGLGFLGNSTYLFPLTGALLAVAIAGLSMRINTAGYGPLVLGLVSAATILSGTFLMRSDEMTFGGAVLLMAASAWSFAAGRTLRSNIA